MYCNSWCNCDFLFLFFYVFAHTHVLEKARLQSNPAVTKLVIRTVIRLDTAFLERSSRRAASALLGPPGRWSLRVNLRVSVGRGGRVVPERLSSFLRAYRHKKLDKHSLMHRCMQANTAAHTPTLTHTLTTLFLKCRKTLNGSHSQNNSVSFQLL